MPAAVTAGVVGERGGPRREDGFHRAVPRPFPTRRAPRLKNPPRRCPNAGPAPFPSTCRAGEPERVVRDEDATAAGCGTPAFRSTDRRTKSSSRDWNRPGRADGAAGPADGRSRAVIGASSDGTIVLLSGGPRAGGPNTLRLPAPRGPSSEAM